MKLKPCPFCGEPLTIRLAYATTSDQYCQAVCENNKCPQNNYYKTTEEALKAYNTRHCPTCETCKYWEKITGRCTDDRGTFYHMVLMEGDGCIHHENREERDE